jgi:hypothetical protein
MNLTKRITAHPYLLAAFPVLALFASNRGEALSLNELIVPLAATFVVVTAFLLLGWLLLRDARAAALVVSGWALLFFSFGHIAERTQGTWLGHQSFLLVEWGILAIGVVWLGIRAKTARHLSGPTHLLNVVGLVLVLMNVVQIAAHRPRGDVQRLAITSESGPNRVANGASAQPDIYYIVPDRYGAETTLRRGFGLDVSPFIRFLEQEGFYVASQSQGNYPATAHSLAASLNMRYLDYLVRQVGEESTDWGPVKSQLGGSDVSRFLQAKGYRYVHIGSWYDGTDRDPTADVNIRYLGWSEFSTALYRTTMLPALRDLLGLNNYRRVMYERTLQQLRNIAGARDLPGPKFVFAHVLLPHPPWIFDRNGNFLTEERASRMSYQQKLREQTTFANKKLEELMQHLLSGRGPRPIVILQTDEGVYPTGESDLTTENFDWRKLSVEQLREKFRILNAYYLPGVGQSRLYPSISPVNSFRLLFDLYFGMTLPLLPDRSYAIEHGRLYKFVDVDDLIDGP